jgi:hypothetical protein
MNILGYFNNSGGVTPKYRTPHATSQGYPISGPALNPNMRGSEFEDIPLVVTVKVRVFDLSDDADLKAYTEVRDRIANRSWIQMDKTKMVSADGTKIKIHLEWAEPEGRPGAGRRGG